VCASAGSAIFMKARVGDVIFFACPECGCAWANPPVPFQVDTIDRPISFAPDGFRTATRQEIDAAGLSTLIRGEHIEMSRSRFLRIEGYHR